VLEAKPIGRIGDRYGPFVGRTRDLQKQLVLLRLETGFLCPGLAEQQEQAQLVAEIRKSMQ
jgi:hypothetical protein